MNQAELQHLVRGLRIKLGKKGAYPMMKQAALRSHYREDLEKARLNVAALVANERLEMKQEDATIVRAYTERLISEAVENGDRHTHTMEMAKWWLVSDTAAIHKLFQVLAPRFKDTSRSYTRMLKAPTDHAAYAANPHDKYLQHRWIVELRGNPFPKLELPNSRPNMNHLHNFLLSAARKEAEAAANKSST